MASGWKRKFVSTVVGSLAPACMPFARPHLIRVLNYHRIHDESRSFLLDPDVISASPELFDRQVAYCKKHFDIMSFVDLEEVFSGQRTLPSRPLIFTFDDGYEDNYSQAYSILKRHGATAMFFLATDYIDTPRLFWWDEVALALNVFEGRQMTLLIAGTPHVLDLADAAMRKRSTAVVLRLLKTVPNTERVRVVQELADTAHTRQRISELPRQSMTWTEVREMAAHGMEIGSHSLSHPILSQVLDDRALEAEIAGSKAVIEERIASRISVFSYPVGGTHAFDARVQHAVVNSGYTFAVTYVNGLNRASPSTNRYALRRLHVDGLDESEFRMRLVAPQL